MNVAPILRRADRPLFVLWAAVCTLASARSFYGYMLKQTGGEWSAPLDDVFIHFDYARATALGHPFEWTIGNGYSSGNTSLTYPFVLALGWLVGFTGRELMKWAAILAAVSVFGTLLAARRLFIDGPRDDWGRLSSYLLPPIFLGIGALTWSLWSGMEVAFFLATWAIALVAWRKLEDDARMASRPATWSAWWLGLAGALLVATRPEAALTIAIFGLSAAHAHRRLGRAHAAALLVRVGLPAVVVLAAQSVANRALTGESSANGAIVKLALHNPFMTPDDKLADWVFNVKYAGLRNLDYHFAHVEGDRMSELVDAWPGAPGVLVYLAKTAWWAGVVPLVLAVLPLCFARTRRIAIVLWAQIIAWIVLVAFNGQVRWQNERYVMPAVAWMLVLAALGVTVALRKRVAPSGPSRARPLRPSVLATLVLGALVVQTVGVLTRPAGMPPVFRLSWLLALACAAPALVLLRWQAGRAIVVTALVLFAWDHQSPKMRDQKWFFGRASRNIRDQHLTLGKYLAELKPKRVLVGDAGAILYESDRPGLDIIGLGGYRGLPFARAGVHGLPATLELMERVPKNDRPDVLAIFPTWWGILPVWFADEVLARFPVEGNVICGGYEHVVYKADWSLLDTGAQMRWQPPTGWEGRTLERVRVEIDVADLVSEKAAGYRFDQPSNGWTDMRILPDPSDPQRDMFDSGRRIAVGKRESFDARGLILGKRIHLVVRTAQEAATTVRVRVDGRDAGTIALERTNGWAETGHLIDDALIGGANVRIELTNEGPGDFLDYHAWVTQ
ncbi:MAG: hypothetical protein KF764_12530 [Labilithrix sp.]|nr:hypothetical protein [Labilithrix sp.]MBX3223768.1 hypothetical protein [Labilithrix sp.]